MDLWKRVKEFYPPPPKKKKKHLAKYHETSPIQFYSIKHQSSSGWM